MSMLVEELRELRDENGIMKRDGRTRNFGVCERDRTRSTQPQGESPNDQVTTTRFGSN